MDDKTYLGSLAEAKVIADMIKHRFFVYQQIGGKAPFDLVVVKDKQLLRVSVKGSNRRNRSGNIEVAIGRIRSNKSQTKIYPFDPEECDLLAAYLQEIDKICYLPSKEIKSKRVITFSKKHSKYARTSRLVDDNLDLEGAAQRCATGLES